MKTPKINWITYAVIAVVLVAAVIFLRTQSLAVSSQPSNDVLEIWTVQTFFEKTPVCQKSILSENCSLAWDLATENERFIAAPDCGKPIQQLVDEFKIPVYYSSADCETAKSKLQEYWISGHWQSDSNATCFKVWENPNALQELPQGYTRFNSLNDCENHINGGENGFVPYIWYIVGAFAVIILWWRFK